MNKPVVAVTMGDPAGVGPEICLKLLQQRELIEQCRPVVVGDAGVLRRVAKLTGMLCQAEVLGREQGWEEIAKHEGPVIFDLKAIEAEEVTAGVCNAASGRASFEYIEEAIRAARTKQVQAVVTGPINKEALHKAGIPFPGHTEIFAERTGAKRWCMMQYAEEITCTFVTVHVGYAEVPKLLTQERVLEVIELTGQALTRIRQRKPKLVVCGLNPHAGEHGLFGEREEERVIIPAIEAARRQGWMVEGPLPPDTAFLPWKRKETDAFVCMYHDQGHIPVKALAFDSAVNTTLGLPVIRTSVDHGTANDIAWQGRALPDSLFSAVRLALRLHQT